MLTKRTRLLEAFHLHCFNSAVITNFCAFYCASTEQFILPLTHKLNDGFIFHKNIDVTWLVLHLWTGFFPALTHITSLFQEGGVSLLTAALENCLDVQWKDQYECVLAPERPPISLEASQRIVEILKILFNITYSSHRQEPSEVRESRINPSAFRCNVSVCSRTDLSAVLHTLSHCVLSVFPPPSGWCSSLPTPGGAPASLPDEEVSAFRRHWRTAGVSRTHSEVW